MTRPSDEEVKIIEKIKFWEEQEKINGILVGKLLNINKEVTVIIAENMVIKQVVTDLENKIEMLSQELNKKQSNKHSSKKSHEDDYKKENNKRFKAIHATFIFSIAALLLSTIGIVL